MLNERGDESSDSEGGATRGLDTGLLKFGVKEEEYDVQETGKYDVQETAKKVDDSESFGKFESLMDSMAGFAIKFESTNMEAIWKSSLETLENENHDYQADKSSNKIVGWVIEQSVKLGFHLQFFTFESDNSYGVEVKRMSGDDLKRNILFNTLKEGYVANKIKICEDQDSVDDDLIGLPSGGGLLTVGEDSEDESESQSDDDSQDYLDFSMDPMLVEIMIQDMGGKLLNHKEEAFSTLSFNMESKNNRTLVLKQHGKELVKHCEDILKNSQNYLFTRYACTILAHVHGEDSGMVSKKVVETAKDNWAKRAQNNDNKVDLNMHNSKVLPKLFENILL
eukprot:UN04978